MNSIEHQNLKRFVINKISQENHEISQFKGPSPSKIVNRNCLLLFFNMSPHQ